MLFKCFKTSLGAKLLLSILVLFSSFQLILGKGYVCGADQPNNYLPLLKNKKVGLIVNQTSRVGKSHLVDFLLKNKIKVKTIFAPEHGFRGNEDAGASIENSMDKKTKVSIVSLYGKNFKPSKEQMEDLDVVIFDIQDVGCRFYTYISTLHYVMEACGQSNKQLIIFDRPNPNGYYIDGPILKPEFQSFVGMHPVPIVHGMTIGEYAGMINGQKWLKDSIQCSLKVIKVLGYTHDGRYNLPIPPSPNLATPEAVALYPSLCWFEGTPVSVGRGTDKPFEVLGSPWFSAGNYDFTPKSIKGKSTNPPYLNEKCKGLLLTKFSNDFIKISKEIYIYWLIGFYNDCPDKEKFFTPFFDKLAGTDLLAKQIKIGLSEKKIRESWEQGLKDYQEIRKKYLLYSDFSGR